MVVGLVLLAGGCATPNYKDAELTSGALRATAEDANASLASIDGTMGVLRELMRTQGGDLRPKYNQFSDSVDRLAASLAALERRTTSIQAAAGGYLEKWDKELDQVQNPQLRKQSMDRKHSIEQGVASVASLQGLTHEQAGPVLSDLQDVRRVLGTDLTRGGLASVELTVVRIETNVAALRDTSSRLSTELAALSADLSPVESAVASAKEPEASASAPDAGVMGPPVETSSTQGTDGASH
jgi:hypothetical protein